MRLDFPSELIAMAGKDLGTVGRDWLMDLSLQYWEQSDGEWRFTVPRDGISGDAVGAALRIFEVCAE
jgi:hypothetical protein